MTGQVECATHGAQARTRVCQHIVHSLYTNIAVGFHWSADDTSPYPDAWCAQCDEAMPFGDAEWSDELTEQVGISTLCAACYQNAKRIWLKARGDVV